MDFKILVARVQGILLKTEEEWRKIKDEIVTVQQLFIPFGAILAAIPAIASFVGFIFALRGHFFGHALFLMIYRYIVVLAAMLILGFIINELAPSFNSKKELIQAMKLSVYSFTPFCVLSILFIFPNAALYWLIVLASLYGAYIFYLGIGILLDTPNDKKLSYTIVVAVIYLVVINLFLLIYGTGRVAGARVLFF